MIASPTRLDSRTAAPLAAAAATVACGTAMGFAIGGGWVYAGRTVAVSVPAAIAFALMVRLRPQTALVGLVGLAVGTLAMLFSTPNVMPLLAVSVLATGSALILARRGNPLDALAGFYAAWIALALLLEGGAVLGANLSL